MGFAVFLCSVYQMMSMVRRRGQVSLVGLSVESGSIETSKARIGSSFVIVHHAITVGRPGGTLLIFYFLMFYLSLSERWVGDQ